MPPSKQSAETEIMAAGTDLTRPEYPHRVLILGCGFTGSRVAAALLRSGVEATGTSRNPNRLASLRDRGLRVLSLDLEADPHDENTIFVENWDAIVYSIPTLRRPDGLWEPATALLPRLARRIPRGIYLSTTGVYGRQSLIDASTEPQPKSDREMRRFEAENACLQSFAQPLVLRPAAIYGPGRGVHASLREGRYRLRGDGINYISRIHVDDLAAHVLAALTCNLSGAWPVADELPCTQREMAAFCANLLSLPLPEAVADEKVAETLRANRRVDGSAVRNMLGISLRYPSYRQGVPACLAAEQQGIQI
jgi:nucleoside-diphosphate-sugar epimerase